MDRIPDSDLPPDPVIPFRPKATPGQIKAFDTRDDRLEIATLLKHLSPARRVQFLAWACSQAWLPMSRIHPTVGAPTYNLLKEARHCDYADEQLTMDVLMSVVHLARDYSFDLGKGLAHLVLMARGKRL